MDGSTTQHNQGSIGGVARTKDGDWLWGFQQNIGHASCTMSEILAIKTGLQLCKDTKVDKILLYSDSMEALNLITSECEESHTR